MRKVSEAAVTALSVLFMTASAAISQTGALLTPTGPYGVGRIVLHWQDDSRPETLSARAADKREVGVWLWYPAVAPPGALTAPYVDQLDALAKSLPGSEVSLARSLQTHSVANANLVGSPLSFPVLIFSPGSATIPALYTSFVEELASRGYVVAALDHPYDNAVVRLSDGRVVKQAKQPQGGEELVRFVRDRVIVRAADIRFVLDQMARMQRGELDSPLKGRLDLSRIGVFGHSVGGLTAAETCMKDDRVKACANFDGVVSAMPVYADDDGRGPVQPFLFVEKPLPAMRGEKPEDAKRRLAFLRQRGNAMLTNVRAGRSYRITMDGATHATFSDEEIASDAGSSRPRQLLEFARAYLVAFFDQVFTGTDSELLSRSPADSAIRIETFPPR